MERSTCSLEAPATYGRSPLRACQGIDVADLLAAAARVQHAIEQLGPDHLDEFDWSLAPQVRWVAHPGSTRSLKPEAHRQLVRPRASNP